MNFIAFMDIISANFGTVFLHAKQSVADPG